MNNWKAVAALAVAMSLTGADLSDLFATRVHAMDYPLLGLQARVSGVVRLRGHVDDTGSITDVKALSGNSVLVRAAAKNLKLWKFARPSSSLGQGVPSAGDVEVIYDFRLIGETNSTPKTEFVYEYPNRVTVTSAAPHWMP